MRDLVGALNLPRADRRLDPARDDQPHPADPRGGPFGRARRRRHRAEREEGSGAGGGDRPLRRRPDRRRDPAPASINPKTIARRAKELFPSPVLRSLFSFAGATRARSSTRTPGESPRHRSHRARRLDALAPLYAARPRRDAASGRLPRAEPTFISPTVAASWTPSRPGG